MDYIITTLDNLVHQTAFFNLTWGNYLMIVVACVFLYLAIAKGFEPLLLLPIAFGMLLVNIYPDIMLSIEDSANGTGGLLYYFYLLDEWARASYWAPQHSLVFSQLTLALSQWALTIRLQRQSPLSVVQTALLPFSLQESLDRPLCSDLSQ